MEFYPQQFYHLYNRGNNKEQVFYSDENYLFFLRKMRTHIFPYVNILAYCLMPNHFHWLICTNEQQYDRKENNPLYQQICTLLSSYSQAINKRFGRTGSLFQQKTKSVHIKTRTHALTCFHYIHQNPIRAGLVNKIGNWPYSSYPDYCGMRDGTLIAKDVTFSKLGIDRKLIIKESTNTLDPQKIQQLY